MSLRPALLLLVALVAADAPAAHAQLSRAPAVPAAPSDPGVAVAPRPGATLVAASVVIPAGSAADAEDAPGTARLVAEAAARAVRWRLDPDAARLEVRVERGWTTFTLLATPDIWVRSWTVLEDVLFRTPLTEAAIDAAREEVLATFVFEEGAPVLEFRRELYRTLAGAGHPWSRDPRGTPASIREVAPEALERFRLTRYVPGPATVAVVGPVGEPAARDAVYPVGSGSRPPRPDADDPAWEDGDRLALSRDMTNTWIGVAFPAPSDLPRTSLEFVAQQLQEQLNPSPPDPGVYSARARIEDTPAGPVVLVDAAVMPEAGSLWERRILQALEDMEEEPEDAFFRWQRRRFRSAILLREGQPEEAALRMALDLLREGRVRPLQDEIWEIGPRDLARSADALEEPRLLIMGPDLGEEGPAAGGL